MSSHIHILCIGSELLNGRTLNTNLLYLGQELASAGLVVTRESCVQDDASIIQATLRQAEKDGELVITIGGLGPTHDDLTREAVADYLGVQLVHDPSHYERLLEVYRRRNREPGNAATRMAKVPEGATTIPNENGTAQGIWCPTRSGGIILMPGPPNELKAMFSNHVLPRLQAENSESRLTICCTVYGTAESEVQRRIGDFVEAEDDLAYRLDFGRCELRLSGPAARTAQLTATRHRILNIFGDDAVLGNVSLPQHVVELVRRRGNTLAAAESCTGGIIGSAITDLAGVSDVFLGSAVTYANSWKEAILGVPTEILNRHGAVSPETAAAMVTGLAERYGADCAVSVTGIAGPGGGSPQKPVGQVEFATLVNGSVQTVSRQFHGDRPTVRMRAAATALNLLRRHLQDSPDTSSGNT